MIDRSHPLPITKQAKVLGISRGSVYSLPRPVPAADLAIMRRMDELHLELPDTVGELVGYAASAAKREMRVGASGRPVNQAVTRSRLRAAAVATCCRRVLARPR